MRIIRVASLKIYQNLIQNLLVVTIVPRNYPKIGLKILILIFSEFRAKRPDDYSLVGLSPLKLSLEFVFKIWFKIILNIILNNNSKYNFEELQRRPSVITSFYVPRLYRRVVRRR